MVSYYKYVANKLPLSTNSFTKEQESVDCGFIFSKTEVIRTSNVIFTVTLQS